MFVRKTKGNFYEYVAVTRLIQTGRANEAGKFAYTAFLSDGTDIQVTLSQAAHDKLNSDFEKSGLLIATVR